MNDSYYDTAQICLNGHVVNTMADSSPQSNQKHCAECGAQTITGCPACTAAIRGHYHMPGVIGFFDYHKPAYCHNCGNAFPWAITTSFGRSQLVGFLSKSASSRRVSEPNPWGAPQPNYEALSNAASQPLVQAEYQVVRELIKESIREIWILERYALIAVAAFWAWLFAQGEWHPWMQVAKYVPAALSAFAALRCFAVYVVVKRLAVYVREKIEKRWGLGWEQFDEQEGPWLLTGLITIFWLVLIAGCLWVGYQFDAWLVPKSKGGAP